MRLIQTSTLEFEEFIGTKIPIYAILSHTWEGEEVSFQDILSQTTSRRKKGYEKILRTCQLALRDGYQYMWIDTCNIDKSSSAELTEAINSMFDWYARSSRCYVYLSDFDSKDPTSDFSRCRWFTRGWTLQEMIAPSVTHFYDKEWRYFGSKGELGSALSAVTGIETSILDGTHPLYVVPVARKMSWAAQRETTREEDHAYCLLGIFGINMPLVYGEGARAFARLQEEIMKETNDLTLFAWQAEAQSSGSAPYRGCLAKSPREFAGAATIVSRSNHKNNPEFSMTNKGLRIEADLRRGPGNPILMSLHCTRSHSKIGIYLVDIGGEVYARDLPHILASHGDEGIWGKQMIYIRKDVKDVRYL